MCREIIKISPVFKTMIWGGNRMRSEFNYDIPGDNTGECWAVSAHDKGDCEIASGTYKGQTLSALWREHRELFGNMEGDRFPLLTKIIDAKTDLSIQVHPDDTYAGANENGSLGKMECWYILACDEDAKLVIGHNARTKEELKDMIYGNRWNELIREMPIKKGDFVQIDPGTVHAIKGGTMLLETQQNSDITYRLYDYGRLQNGKPRELHLEKSIDVITVPYEEKNTEGLGKPLTGGKSENLITCEYYSVWKLDVDGAETYVQDKNFLLLSCTEGECKIDGTAVKKGDHMLLPAGYGEFKVEGKAELIAATAEK